MSDENDLRNTEYAVLLKTFEDVLERLTTCDVADPELTEGGVGTVSGAVWLDECFGITLNVEVKAA